MFSKTSNKWSDYLFLSVFLGVLFLVGLGSRPLASPDEGRYAEIPREMVETGEYITPHLNGLKYFEKPPFVYWLEALPLKMGLPSEFWLRLPIALFGLLGCLSVYQYTKRIYSHRAACFSSLVLGTSLLYFSLARLIILDLVLTVFISIGLLSFIQGVKLTGMPRRGRFMLASAALSCAVLTKGLIGLILPVAIIGIWVIGLNKWKELRPLYLPTNLLIFALIAFPWHILVSARNPEFFDFYFIREHFERYFTTIHRRLQPAWFFIPVTLLGFFPWVVFLPRAVKNFIPFKFKDWKVYDLEAFLIIWISTIFLFFSFSSSKLIPYILPIFPPLSIVVGRFLAYVAENNYSLKIESIIYGIIAFALAFSIPMVAQKYCDPHLYELLSPYFLYVQIALVGGGLSFLILGFFKKTQWQIISLLTFHIAFLFMLNSASVYIQKASMKPFSTFIRQTLSPKPAVIVYGVYPQDLPFYLGETVKVLNWSGELDAGKSFNPSNHIFIKDTQFKNAWGSANPHCVITTSSRIPYLVPNAQPLYKQDDYVLVCNSAVKKSHD